MAGRDHAYPWFIAYRGNDSVHLYSRDPEYDEDRKNNPPICVAGTYRLSCSSTEWHRQLADPLDLEERAANLISDSIRPRLLPDLEIVSYRNTQVLAVRVYPSPARPHYIARAGRAAGTYVRVGSTNRQADAELIAELQRFASGRSFDERPMPALDPEALDFRVDSESLPSCLPPSGS